MEGEGILGPHVQPHVTQPSLVLHLGRWVACTPVPVAPLVVPPALALAPPPALLASAPAALTAALAVLASVAAAFWESNDVAWSKGKGA